MIPNHHEVECVAFTIFLLEKARCIGWHGFKILVAFLTSLKASASEETLFPKQNCVRDAKNVFGKFQKHLLLSRRRVCFFNICYMGAQTRKQLGHNEEPLTSNASRMFPHLRTQATYFEDVELASRKQKVFCFLLFRPSLQHCEQH